MTSLGVLTREAAFATDHPPQSLSAFRLTALDPPALETPINWAAFALRCAACDGQHFQVGSFPIFAPDPSPFYEVLPGQRVDRPPHRLKCAGCGAIETVLDVRKHGYDGRLNGGAAYESGVVGEEFTDSLFRIIVTPHYNISLEELTELAPQAGPGMTASDLFDWFNIIGKPVGAAAEFEWSYECA
jgi:hypothetical protein